jgi:hypothetical protein
VEQVAQAHVRACGVAVVLLMLAIATASPIASAQLRLPTRFESVLVYSDHFEAGGQRFESAEALRKYLESVDTHFNGVNVRECGAEEQVRKAIAVIMSVAADKAVKAGGKKPVAFDMALASIPCPSSGAAR